MNIKLERDKPHIRLVGFDKRTIEELKQELNKVCKDITVLDKFTEDTMRWMELEIKEAIKQSKIVKHTTATYPEQKLFIITKDCNLREAVFRGFLINLEKMMKVSPWTQIHVILATTGYTANEVLENLFDKIYTKEGDTIKESLNKNKDRHLNKDVIDKLKGLELKQGRTFTFDKLEESLQGKTRELDTHTEVVNGLEYLRNKNYITRESNEIYKVVVDTFLW